MIVLSLNGSNGNGYLWLLANVIGAILLIASKDWLITIAAGSITSFLIPRWRLDLPHAISCHWLTVLFT
jgi:hypothetical protein